MGPRNEPNSTRRSCMHKLVSDSCSHSFSLVQLSNKYTSSYIGALIQSHPVRWSFDSSDEGTWLACQRVCRDCITVAKWWAKLDHTKVTDFQSALVRGAGVEWGVPRGDPELIVPLDPSGVIPWKWITSSVHSKSIAHFIMSRNHPWYSLCTDSFCSLPL